MQRRRILFPLGNLMLPSATLKSLGGVASFNFDKNNRMSTKMLNEKYFVQHLTSTISFSFFCIRKNFKGKNPWIFPHRGFGSGRTGINHPSCRNRCPQRSQSAPEDFWERQEIANVQNTRGGKPKKKPGGNPSSRGKITKSPFFSGRCRERAQVARSAGCF